MKDMIKSVFKVFNGKQKRNLFGMAVLMLINAGVSLLGVSVLLPFIQAVMTRMNFCRIRISEKDTICLDLTIRISW